ncbi:MAG TPA: hypothetical protein VFV67_23685 [Actinophytocola sp.]|uniref:hypothetical protein n=1 Tax=Actinophytocola sp. TaxID=1872138 RepID=UPI002DBEBCA9|nr:hypothetical protein [Actinophytocola sp.]HEU5473660.1 hypothetical protein [Actinophytocola sp.]
MHDIDQVQLEESGPPLALREREYEDEYTGEYEDESEDFLEFEDENEPELGENAEVELATQFLEITSEQELEHFLGDVLRTVTGAASDFARSREGRQIGGILKKAAGRVLPVLGRAAGGAAGAALAGVTGGSRSRYRKAGARAGGALGTAAKRYFGLELEGMSAEDQEFEVARQFVRFATDAIRNCLRRVGTGPAAQVARQATVAAAREQAPGLITDRMLETARIPRSSPAAQRATQTGTAARKRRGCACGVATGMPRAGRWEMRGNTIVLLPR